MKTFYHLLVNNLIAGVTNFTVWFALVFFVYLQTQSVFATSIISGIWLVSSALSGFWFGSLVDHHNKKWIMLVSSGISLVVYIASFILYLSIDISVFSDITQHLLWVFVMLLITGVIAGNIRNIALPTLVTILVDEKVRDKANGLVGATSGVSFLVTSVISGLLVGYSGMWGVLIVAMTATVISIIHLWFIEVKEIQAAHDEESDQASRNIDIKGTIKAISQVPGLMALILFATVNNFLGGVFMSLMDAYGLSMVSVQVWGLLFGALSVGFIVGGALVSKFGLGKNPLKSLFLSNIVIWIISAIFTIQPWLWLLAAGMFIYLCVVPIIEAAEQTIIQKVVPQERQGRVFGFSQSVEQAASPLTAFAIGPLTQFIFIPFMTDGSGAELIGSWFGTGPSRGIALVFTITGLIGLAVTLVAMNTKYYRLLSQRYSGAE